MSDVMLTPIARQWLADRRREAMAIILNGNAYTESQRRTAWAALTGQQPHPRARRHEAGGVMAGLGPQPDDDGDVA